jgi:hypothetical protein
VASSQYLPKGRTLVQSIIFSDQWDLVFDRQGVTPVRRGTVPHIAAEARIVLQCAEPANRLHQGIGVECSAAADKGLSALRTWVRENFQPTGQAAAGPTASEIWNIG